MKTLPTLLPCIEGIQINEVSATANAILLRLATTASIACCPLCGKNSDRVHSYYPRTLADAPWNQVQVSIHLRARRFFCGNAECPRKVFAESVSELAEPYARKTKRLQSLLYLVGYALGGEAGARIAVELGLQVSPDTLLNRLRQVSKTYSVPENGVQILGVDDWAFRKGHRYGTVLVDLQRRKVLELLPDRTSETLAEWLTNHPEIEIVSRDRAGSYAVGARQGTPQAQQVADRFHLLKNATELLERLLLRQHRLLREVSKEQNKETPPVTPLEIATSVEPKPPNSESQSRRERRLARYQEVLKLHEQGLSHRAISRKTGIARPTVRKWIVAKGFPETVSPSPRFRPLGLYSEHLRRRWQEGCHNARVLHSEVQSQGFQGGIAAVKRYVRSWRQQTGPSSCSPEAPPSARCVAWWLLGYYHKVAPDKKAEQMAFVEALCKLSPDIQRVRELVLQFVLLVRERRVADFDAWLASCEQSSLAELVSFAKGLRQDYSAVRAALTSEWSNGQVEGQVNRLKLVKRQMYGRGKLDLLRARVLPPVVFA